MYTRKLPLQGHANIRVDHVRSKVVAQSYSSLPFTVRPYTVTSGDTMTSIAKKRGITLEELTSINHNLANPDSLQEGQTIVIPAGKLSSRDKEIISGIGKGSYRTYPVRKGEKIQDIANKRGIRMAEIEKLNAGADLNSLSEGQIIKLPQDKFTVREREMLTSIGAPDDFFSDASRFASGFVVGGIAFTFATIQYFKATQNDNSFIKK